MFRFTSCPSVQRLLNVQSDAVPGKETFVGGIPVRGGGGGMGHCSGVGRSRGQERAAPLLGICWALCLLYASCLSLPGSSVVQQGLEQEALVLDSPARGLAMLTPALGSSWRILHSFGLQGRQRAQPCAGQWHRVAIGFEPHCDVGRAELWWMGQYRLPTAWTECVACTVLRGSEG